MRALLFVAGFLSSPALAYETITIDGTNDFGPGIAGTSGSMWFVENDGTNLYIGVDATDVGGGAATKFVTVYLDTTNGDAQGHNVGVVYNTQEPALPFEADFHLRWKTDNTYTNLLDYNNGTNSWLDDNTGANNFGIAAFQAGNFVEFSIPLASLGNPTDVSLVGAMINEQGGAEYTFFMWPAGNTEAYDADFTVAYAYGIASPPPVPVPFLPVWALAAMAGGLGVAGARSLRDEA